MKMALITETDIAKIVEDGKNFVTEEDFASAVDHFAKALEDLVPKYGEVHPLLGNVYFYYGRALLGFAKDEADALVENMVPKDGNPKEETEKPEAITEETEDDKDEEEADKKENEADKKEVVSDKKENGEESDKKEENGEEADEKEENGEDEKSAEQGEESEEESAEKGEESADDKDDDVDNLQVAWEVLELARKIFEGEGEEGKEMLVETLYYLGNVSIENENFLAAVDDLILCAKYHNVDKGSLRRHSEIHFKLALAYSMSQKFDESIESLNKAKELLERRIKELTTDEEKKELGELQDVIKEIDLKKTDVEVYKEEAHKSVLELLKGVTAEMSSGVAQEDKKVESPKKLTPKKAEAKSEVVNDISHLVRRKRTSEEEPEATSPKKPTMSTT